MAQTFYKRRDQFMRKRDDESHGACVNTDLIIIELDEDINNSLKEAAQVGRPYVFCKASDFYDALVQVKNKIGIK